MATGRLGTTPVLRTRWSKEPAGGTTSLSGLDDYSVSLVYEVGYEAVYQNGALLSRGNDYTATDGTTITLTNATVAGDIIEVFANNVVPLTDTYSQSVADSKFINNTLTTTTGDIIYASAANTPARLGIGSTNQVLTVSGGVPTWAAAGGFTGCLLYRNNASLSFTQNVTKIFDGYSETLDTDAFHDTVTNTSRITIPTGLGGKYKVYGNFNSTTADKTAEVYLYKNGSVLQEYGIYNGEVNSRYEAQARPALSFIAYIDFAAGDYLEYGIKSNWVTGTYGVYFQLAVERIAS